MNTFGWVSARSPLTDTVSADSGARIFSRTPATSIPVQPARAMSTPSIGVGPEPSPA